MPNLRHTRHLLSHCAIVRRAVVGVMMCLVLAQATLGYLTTPILMDGEHDGSVVTVLLCTLQGEKYLDVEYPEFAADNELEVCPALDLAQMLSTGLVFDLGNSLAVLPQVATAIVDRRNAVLSAITPKGYSSRAPPVLV